MKNSFIAVVSILLVLFTGTDSFSQEPLFELWMVMEAGPTTTDVVASDLDADGDSDIVALNWGNNTISVLENTGKGIFEEQVQYTVGSDPGQAFRHTTGDIDGDGNPDIAVANEHGTVSVLKNLGDGSFGTYTEYATGSDTRSVVLVDLDGDEDRDIAVANSGSNTVSILMNYGDGTYEDPVDYGTGDWPNSVCAADLDGDEVVDLATANHFGNSVSILINRGDGTFEAQVQYSVGGLPRKVTAADLDRDGDNDLALSRSTLGEISVLKNNGDGTFQPYIPYGGGIIGGFSVIASDVDADGDDDLVAPNQHRGSVAVLFNDGTGDFSNLEEYPAGSDPRSVFAADLDGDGDNDLAVGSVTGATVTTLRNNSPLVLYFMDISQAAGVGDEGFGNGVAWGDYDDDGLIDLYVCNFNGYNVLYRNNGNDTFEDVSFVSGTGHPGDCVGSAWGDYDNDGDLDLFLATSNYQANVLFRNNGDGVFTDITVEAGLIELAESRSAAWGDYDGDSYLDLFVAGRLDNLLYHNLGDGTFENVTDELGMEGDGDSRGSSWGDYDGDGDQDLYVANGGSSGTQNELYRNNGDGTFTERGSAAGVDDSRRSQGVSWGDYNNDGLLDLYVTNGGYEGQRNTLYGNNGDGTFIDVTTTSGVGCMNKSFGAAWSDYDNDSVLDLFVANSDTTNVFYKNLGDGTFEDISVSLGLNDNDASRGVACADFDSDGDIDLYVANNGTSNTLYQNIGTTGNWLQIKTAGVRSNPDGVGTKVKMFSSSGMCFDEISAGTGFGSMHSLMMEFGLGEDVTVDSFLVEWPSGVRQKAGEVDVNQVIDFEETWPLIEASPESSFVEPGEIFGLTLAVENPSLEYPTIKLQVSIIAVLNSGREIQVLRPVPGYGFTLPADGKVEATFPLEVPEMLPPGFNCTLRSVLLDYSTGFIIDSSDTYVEVIETSESSGRFQGHIDLSQDMESLYPIFIPVRVEIFH